MGKKEKAELGTFPEIGLATDEQVARFIGVTAKTIWCWTGGGKFPQPLKISERCTRWRGQDVMKFVESKIEIGGEI